MSMGENGVQSVAFKLISFISEPVFAGYVAVFFNNTHVTA